MGVAENVNSKHLAAGSKCPPLAPGKLRIYNMRFCPFAERTMLALLLKGVDFEVVNVDLKSKPEWFLAKNPLGKVPTLEKDGKIVYESGVCNEYLEDAGIGKKIYASDPLQKAHDKILLERLSGITNNLYGAARGDEEKIKALNDGIDMAEKLLTERDSDYFSGKECGSVDCMLWPWFERISVIQVFTSDKVKIDSSKHPKLAAYCKRMESRAEIKSYLLDTDTHVHFIKSNVDGKPDYDYLITKSGA